MKASNGYRRILVWADLSAYWGRQLVQGIAAGEQRQSPWFLHVISEPAALDSAVRHWRPDGLILPRWNPSEYEFVRAYSMPTVTVFTEQPTAEGTPVLACDNEAIGSLGARHLLETGAASYAFVGFDEPMFSLRRMEGFRKRIEAAEQRFEPLLLPDGALPDPFADDAARGALARRLRALPKPCAAMCSNDAMARTLAMFCLRLGLRIPQEVAILGVDDDDVQCRTVAPPLSSVRLPFAQIGLDAARILNDWLNGRHPEPIRQVYSPTEVAVRESTVIHRVPDALMSRALKFLDEHRGEPVNVATLIRHTGVARRTLEQRFKETLGHTPLMEIRRQRILYAKRLLAETREPMNAIARQSGFKSLVRFSKVFKELTGMTPTEYRRHHPL